MFFLKNFAALRLDIVGIIAVLGEGSITRNAQVAALTWHAWLFRLLPAPQALIKHEREPRLPTEQGTVVGVYSGNLRHELNFFTSVLHPRRLEPFEVELVRVKPKEHVDLDEPAYGYKPHSALLYLSILGCVFSIALIVLSAVYDDGMSLIATIFLSTTSTIVGVASSWTLQFPARIPPKEGRSKLTKNLPDGDVVIYYPPQGAFRVIQCEEDISRLYFTAEACKYTIEGDNAYRALASFATILLMIAVIALANASNNLQVAFALAYVILNALHWASSALNPLTQHWSHKFEVEIVRVCPPNKRSLEDARNIREPDEHTIWGKASRYFHEKRVQTLLWFSTDKRAAFKSLQPRLTPENRNFTTALWTAIALTGSSKWLNEATHIAPWNEAWAKWIEKAEVKAAPRRGLESGREEFMYTISREKRRMRTKDWVEKADNEEVIERPAVILPPWDDYKGELTRCLERYFPNGERPEWPNTRDILTARGHNLEMGQGVAPSSS